MKMLGCLLPCCCLLLAGVTACPAGDKKPTPGGTIVDLDGLKSKTPADWLKQKPSNRLRPVSVQGAQSQGRRHRRRTGHLAGVAALLNRKSRTGGNCLNCPPI